MTREEAIAIAKMEAAQAALKAALLSQTDAERGCPQGYAGSCQRLR